MTSQASTWKSAPANWKSKKPSASVPASAADLLEIEQFNSREEQEMQRIASCQGKISSHLFKLPPGMVELLDERVAYELDSLLGKDIYLLQKDITKMLRRVEHEGTALEAQWAAASKHERKQHILKAMRSVFRGDVAEGQMTAESKLVLMQRSRTDHAADRRYAFEIQMNKLLVGDYFVKLVHKCALDTEKDNGRSPQHISHQFFDNVLSAIRQNPGGDYLAHDMLETRTLILALFAWNVLLSLYGETETMYAAKRADGTDRMAEKDRERMEKISGKQAVDDANYRPTAFYRCEECNKGEMQLEEGQKMKTCCEC